MIKKKTIRDLKNIAGKTVFLTVDFNISLTDGKITNETRIVEALPTIDYLIKKGVKLILASHLGRPKGHDANLSLLPVAKRLEKHILRQVNLIDRFWEKETVGKIKLLPKNSIVMLENIRFHPGEKENDPNFVKHLASMADFFVNDAFGTAHRVHASTVGIAECLPSYAGFLMAKEIEMLSNAMRDPKRPFLVIIGGAKTPEKISVIDKILDIADTVILGGAIANTFLAAWGFGMGYSKVDYEMVEMTRVLFWKTTRTHSALILPLDVVTSDREKRKSPQIYEYNQVPHDLAIYDIGPKTRKYYDQLIKNAKTVIWNGPMGLYEDKLFSQGTDSILESLAESHATTIVGGGDTLTSIKSKQYLKKISHISTGGGAMLEFMKQGTLPGIEVIQNI